MKTKTCRTCGETKPRDDFPRNNSYSDGRRPYCKSCWKQRLAKVKRERR